MKVYQRKRRRVNLRRLTEKETFVRVIYWE